MSLYCSICYEDINENCRIDSCNHLFCISCITEWGKKGANTCPCCRQKFNVLYDTNNSLIDYFVDKENNYEDDEEDDLGYERFYCVYVIWICLLFKARNICAPKIPQIILNRKLKGCNKYMDMAHYQRTISL